MMVPRAAPNTAVRRTWHDDVCGRVVVVSRELYGCALSRGQMTAQTAHGLPSRSWVHRPSESPSQHRMPPAPSLSVLPRSATAARHPSGSGRKGTTHSCPRHTTHAHTHARTHTQTHDVAPRTRGASRRVAEGPKASGLKLGDELASVKP